MIITIAINIITYYDYVRENGSLSSSSSSFSFYHTNKEVFVTLIDTLIRMIAGCAAGMEFKREEENEKNEREKGRKKEGGREREGKRGGEKR